jgi:hypothetical protein
MPLRLGWRLWLTIRLTESIRITMDPKLKAVRKRLKDEFAFYSRNAVKIRTKNGEIRPLILNPVQQKLDQLVEAQYRAEGKVRVVILKARQQGLSTYTSGKLYFRLSQMKAKKGLVVAHKADSTRALFDMYQRIHAETPEALKQSTKYSSRKELVFDKLQSGLMVATAGGDGIARGETITHCHLSEVAFWPVATAADNLNALLQAIPNTPDTEIYVESTANGMTGVFYELWQGAVNGTNGFIPFFSPWFDSEEYRVPVPEGFERTFEEEELVAAYGLDDEQLMFRRQKVAQTSREQFMQEYPSNADEAFITSGRPVFNPEQITERLREAPEPIARMAVEEGVVRLHPRGELLVYYKHDPSEVYTIGADVGMGVRDGDFSVAQVLDSSRRQVAVWRGLIHPDAFADILQALGFYYNTARIAPENNNHGILTAVRLGRDLAYPNVYTEVGEGKLNDQQTISIGFRTNVKTKPLIIDRLRASCREQEIEINDKATLREMLSYVVNESGQMEAEPGCHDDCVMSLAIANHCHEGKFIPIEVTDDYYFEAI